METKRNDPNEKCGDVAKKDISTFLFCIIFQTYIQHNVSHNVYSLSKISITFLTNTHIVMINSSNAIPTYEEILKLNRMLQVTHYDTSSLNNKIVFNTDGYSNLNLMYNGLDGKILSTGQGFGYLYMSRSSNVRMVSTPIYFDTANPNTVIISRCWLPDTPTMVECDVQIRLYKQLTGEIKICEPNSDEPLDSITAWNGKLGFNGYVSASLQLK